MLCGKLEATSQEPYDKTRTWKGEAPDFQMSMYGFQTGAKSSKVRARVAKI
jgi:hypothetical protein